MYDLKFEHYFVLPDKKIGSPIYGNEEAECLCSDSRGDYLAHYYPCHSSRADRKTEDEYESS